ncbi:MAG: response regulator [Alphaproteobacteria bacterium]|nr:response regulator [Alphaproteobacteria bacterium]
MKIRTRAVMLGWVAMAAIAALVVVNAAALLRQVDIDERLVGINDTLSDLRFVDELATEILHTPNERAATQWNILIERLDGRLQQLFQQLDINEGFQGEIRGRLNAIDRTVDRLNDAEKPVNAAAKRALVGRLSANRNALFTQIERLQSELAQRRTRLIETTALIVAVSVLIAAAVVLASSIILRRTVLAAVDEIGTAVERLKPGETEAIRTTRTDEIGDMLRGLESARVLLQQAFEREATSRQAAEELSIAKSSFIATTSHELRTPLNGLLGSLAILSQTELDADQARYTQMARRSGDALLSVINDVLDFSRIDSGGMQFENVAFLPALILKDTVSIHAPIAEQKNLAYRLDADLDDGLALFGDPDRIRQILNNLIGNALKFTDKGSVTVRAWLDKARLGATKDLIIEISDTGIGIQPDKMRAIFEPFAQADGSTARRFGGSGLGLAISAKLARAMGGDLVAESEVGVGSTFRLTLSLKSAKRDDVLSVADAINAESEANALKGLHVLVVDDVEINRVIATDMLRKWGCLVSEAQDGRNALEALDQYRYDIVLMDIQMPELDGLTATRRARASGHTLPIVGLTANAFKEQREEYTAGGMDDVISKPVDWLKLHECLIRLCAGSIRKGENGVRPPEPPPSDNALGGVSSANLQKQETEGMLTTPVLDATTIQSLQSIMERDKLRLLAKKAVDQVYDSIETLRAPHSAEERRHIAHTIKGMCGNLGFAELADVSRDLEYEDDGDNVPGHLDRLNHAVERTRAEFDALIQ